MLRANQAHCSEWSRLCVSALPAFPSPHIRLTPITTFQKKNKPVIRSTSASAGHVYNALMYHPHYRPHTHSNTHTSLSPPHTGGPQLYCSLFFLFFFCCEAAGDPEEELASHESRHEFSVNGLSPNVRPRRTQPTYGGIFNGNSIH